MTRIFFEAVDRSTPPDPLIDVFNSNRDFLIASGDKYPYSASEVATYFHEETRRQNGRCLLIRISQTGEVAGTVGMAVPYEKVGCPWIGLLLIGKKWQGQGIGSEAAAMLSRTLAEEGWGEIQLGVLKTNPGAKQFWERQGYRVIEEREDQQKHPIWIMSKSLAGDDQASGSAT